MDMEKIKKILSTFWRVISDLDTLVSIWQSTGTWTQIAGVVSGICMGILSFIYDLPLPLAIFVGIISALAIILIVDFALEIKQKRLQHKKDIKRLELEGNRPTLIFEFEETPDCFSNTENHDRPSSPYNNPVTSSNTDISYVTSGVTNVSSGSAIPFNSNPRSARWVHIKLISNNCAAHNCSVKISNVEKWSDAKEDFGNTSFVVSQITAWAGEPTGSQKRYNPRTIYPNDLAKVDAFYTENTQPNRLCLPVEEPLQCNANLFGDLGIYRLTFNAVSNEGASARIALIVDWKGKWNDFNVCEESKWSPHQANLVQSEFTPLCEVTRKIFDLYKEKNSGYSFPFLNFHEGFNEARGDRYEENMNDHIASAIADYVDIYGIHKNGHGYITIDIKELKDSGNYIFTDGGNNIYRKHVFVSPSTKDLEWRDLRIKTQDINNAITALQTYQD